jgi:hypothetical protein
MARQKKPFDAVQFTRESAERVARVVRQAETTPAAGVPLQFGTRFTEREKKPVRIGTFTGSWPIGSTKNVTFKYQTATPNTAAVQNDLINLPSAGTRNCVIGREGTAWHLINWQWDIAHAATAATLTTTSLRFDTLPVGAVSTSSTVTFSVSVATCSTA